MGVPSSLASGSTVQRDVVGQPVVSLHGDSAVNVAPSFQDVGVNVEIRGMSVMGINDHDIRPSIELNHDW